MNLIEQLENFIKTTKSELELKRALAAKMAIQKKKHREICQLLQVSQSFVSTWKNQVIVEGIESLKVKYKGSKGYLSSEQKKEVIDWVKSKERSRIEDLQIHIEQKHGVVYQSLQTYYNLFKEAQISWKKVQKKNPRKDDILVEEKKQEIKEFLEEKRPEIEAGKLAVFMLDECHLLSGDVLGYTWGPTNKRVEIPIKNEKERQTYYGAIDYYTHEFLLKSYSSGNSENTKDFLDYLQCQRPGQRIAIFWDGASYHRSLEIRSYLEEINSGLQPEEWQITCTLFAPNAPEQNPVEDIWLQTKNFLRKFSHYCSSFKVVKLLFELFASGQVFNFPKLYEYADFTRPI